MRRHLKGKVNLLVLRHVAVRVRALGGCYEKVYSRCRWRQDARMLKWEKEQHEHVLGEVRGELTHLDLRHKRSYKPTHKL